MITRSRIFRRLTARLAAAALLAALLVSGCGRNKPSSLLAPTGLRPVPESPSGGIWGYLVFDPSHYAGLDQAPFPQAQLDLYDATGKHVDSLLTPSGSRRFEFDHVPPGHYGITVRAHAFKPVPFGSFFVTTFVQDVGDLNLTANYDSLYSTVFLIGTMPGFSTDELNTFSTLMDQNESGVWTYPSSWGATTVPAGTFRMKFVTDASSLPNHLIGWGGDSTQVLTPPVTDAPMHFGTGPASDLKVTFPAAGTYLFTFDERRLTFSIVPGTAPTLAARGGFRRNR